MINYDWNEIVFQDKGDLKKKNYIFIAGSREISNKRLIEIIKTNLPKANLLVGILKNEFIEGFEDQIQFKSMNKEEILPILEKISKVKLPKSVDSIEYSQQDLSNILEKLRPQKVLFVNGSWSRMFHLRQEFYTLTKNQIKYELISAFTQEEEAKEYYNSVKKDLSKLVRIEKSKSYKDEEIFEILNNAAKQSFATDFQTSCAIVKNKKILIVTHNEIIPFETYAMLNGSVKEKNFSPPNDLNHYDTNHAEMMMMLQAQEKKINLNNCSLYINLMPCPTCARILSKTKIKEIVYIHDHSDGYAAKLFTQSGKIVRRFIN